MIGSRPQSRPTTANCSIKPSQNAKIQSNEVFVRNGSPLFRSALRTVGIRPEIRGKHISRTPPGRPVRVGCDQFPDRINHNHLFETAYRSSCTAGEFPLDKHSQEQQIKCTITFSRYIRRRLWSEPENAGKRSPEFNDRDLSNFTEPSQIGKISQ
jgi:hypothetical protein